MLANIADYLFTYFLTYLRKIERNLLTFRSLLHV